MEQPFQIRATSILNDLSLHVEHGWEAPASRRALPDTVMRRLNGRNAADQLHDLHHRRCQTLIPDVYERLRSAWHSKHSLRTAKAVHRQERKSLMNKLTSWSRAKMLNVVGLLGAFIGLLTLIVIAVTPTDVLPMVLILLVVTSLVAFLPWRWVPIIGMVLPLFMLVGAVATLSIFIAQQSNLSNIVAILGMVVQLLGLITAVPAGIVATVQNYRSHKSAAS
jgi:hypothetical protein